MSATTFSSKPPWTGPQQSRRIGAAKPAKGRRGSGHILRDLARQALVHAAADAGVLRGTESSHARWRDWIRTSSTQARSIWLSEQRCQILWDNCARLYAIKTPRSASGRRMRTLVRDGSLNSVIRVVSAILYR